MAVCPNCGEENPEKAKFCLECATPLKVAPPSQAEERKVVSVLFVDLVGFTSRSHDADPEDIHAVLGPYHRLLESEIEQFGGTVEKFIGDAVMAVFGAPVAHEDDAERAVRAALRITEAIEELNEVTPNLDLSIRAAVNTGEGLVTLGARPQAGEGMVTGDVVNTASRLQGIAPVGSVAVGEVTYRSTKNFFSYESLDPVSVKGKPEPIPIWRAVSARSRFGVDVDMAPKTPFIGRDFDLAALKNAYQRTLREASVQLVTITGEPGVGKTRLLAEFSSFIDEQDDLVYWRQGRSLPYGEGITFWALGEIVKAQAGILESDSPGTASDKLQVGVEAVVEETDERTWFVARLGPLVGTKASQSGGGVEKEESFTAWRRFLEAIASRSPLVVVFEDLHWADAAMLEFIDHLVEWSTGVPLLVICTARPELYESHQGWGGGKRNSNTISLSPLSDSETAQLISGLLSQAVLPAEVHTALLERAGGNPLYAEEFIRMLSDQGILQRKGRVLTLDPHADIPIPDNVQALIAARLDTLPAERKALLHDASVTGKVFWSGAVSALGERDDREVREGLHELSRKELVRPARNSSMEGQQEYSFWHALVRDVAYGQIPRPQRASKHQGVARWLESIAGERVADHAEVLAQHYSQALELADAYAQSDEVEALQVPTRRFLAMAGDRALSLDVRAATKLYQQALRFFPADHPKRGPLLLSLARATHGAGELPAAQSLYEEAIALLLAHGNARRAGEALLQLGYLLWIMGKVSEAKSILRRALDILTPEGPSPELALAYSHLSNEKSISDDLPQEGLEWAQKGLDLAQQVNSSSAAMVSLANRGYARSLMGDEGGIEDVRASVQLGKQLGLASETSESYANLAAAIYSHYGSAAMLATAQQAVSFARSRGLRESEMWSRGQIASSLYLLGDWEQALAELNEIILWSEEHQAVQAAVGCRADKLRIFLERGDLTAEIDLDKQVLRQARAIEDLQIVLPVLVLAARAEAAQGNWDHAMQLLEEFQQKSASHPPLLSEQLPDVVRLAMDGGGEDLAATMIEVLVGHQLPKHSQHCVVTAKARQEEARGNHQEAASLYAQAFERWADYGFVLEEGQAHLGLARCLIALGDREAATEPLQKARAIFSPLGAVPLLNEVEGYLGEVQAASG